MKLPVACVTRSVLVGRTARTPTNAINVLITLGRVLGEVDASAEHASNVGVAFVEAFLHDGVDERRSVEQHPFVGKITVIFGHFDSTMAVPVPKFLVLNFLNLKRRRLHRDVGRRKTNVSRI